MRTSQTFSKYLVACSVALAMALSVSVFGAQSGAEGSAVAKKVSGTVKYSNPGGSWQALTDETILKAGDTIQTAGDGSTDIWFNNSDVISIGAGSTVTIEKLTKISAEDSGTSLNLQLGSIIGNVKKISKASHFDIRTPNGVAGIRGTMFSISVKSLDNGKFQVIFTCVEGLVVVATPNVVGEPTLTTLNDQMTYTTGLGEGVVGKLSEGEYQQLRHELDGLIPPPTVPGNVQGNPEAGNVRVNSSPTITH